jgi:hypothetical protein
LAHARRKFFELHATNKSQLAEQALRYIQLLYEIESEVRVRIPRPSGHLFHEHPATDSMNIRPPIPRTSGHP